MLPDGTPIEANETALAFGGIDRDDVVGEKPWETDWFQVSEETREQAKADVERAAGGEFVRRELAVQGADRTAIIDFSIKPVTDELGEVELLVPEGRDITELTERERELQRQSERFEAFASVAAGFFVADDGRGIPADDRSAVFRSGSTTAEGTGFGLAITEAGAEAHGWEITATERDCGAARFEITAVEAG